MHLLHRWLARQGEPESGCLELSLFLHHLEKAAWQGAALLVGSFHCRDLTASFHAGCWRGSTPFWWFCFCEWVGIFLLTALGVLCFVFWHFNDTMKRFFCDATYVGFWVPLLWDIYFFPWLRKFSAVISLNRSCFLVFVSSIPWMFSFGLLKTPQVSCTLWSYLFIFPLIGVWMSQFMNFALCPFYSFF